MLRRVEQWGFLIGCPHAFMSLSVVLCIKDAIAIILTSVQCFRTGQNYVNSFIT